MPRAKDDTPASTDPEQGFAALEAKVEELQQEAVQEAGVAASVAASAPPLVALEVAAGLDDPIPPEFPTLQGVPSPISGASAARASELLKTSLGAVAAYTQDALRLHTEALSSLAKVRSPQDFLAAQMDYGRQALELYMSSIARWTQAAVPAYAPARQTGG